MAQQNIKLGQTTIEQVKKIDDNFTELYNKDSNLDERLDSNETAVSGIDTRLKKVESNYITNAVKDLENYYTKTQTDSKIDGLQNQISQIPKFAVKVVTALPTENISTTTIYLLKTSETETGNLYTEYIYVDGKWEELGTQTLDLSGYATKKGYNDFTGTNTFSGPIAISQNEGSGLNFTDRDGDISDLMSLSRAGEYLYWGDDIVATMDMLDDYSQEKHSQKQLTDENLNLLYGVEKVGWYFANGSNTVTNKPVSGNIPFYLEVGLLNEDAPLVYQKVIAYNGGEYTRIQGASGWSVWKQVATTDNIPTNIVSGVKGDSETAYRTGEVNITKSNIGLGNVDNVKQYSASNPNFSTDAPKMDGTAAVGTSTNYARADHTHPTDTSRASTAVATVSSKGLMSSTDKSRLDSLYSNTLVKITKSFESNSCTSLTLNGSTYYGYFVGDDSTSIDITRVTNSNGYGIVYQEYRIDSATYVVVSEKMALTVDVIGRNNDV